MPDLLKNLSAAMRASTTYRIGLMQAKAYRLLKARTMEALEPLGITTIEWAFLGLLHDAPKGIRASTAAAELGVEAPFITELTSRLQKKQLILISTDPSDSRAKLMCLSVSGRKFVKNTEKVVRAAMRPVAKGIATADLITYIAVLEAISSNSEKK